MPSALRVPKRFMPIFLEAQEQARIRREQNSDSRTAILAEIKAKRVQRDRQRKIDRTMQIARERTAERRTASSSRYQVAA